MRSQDRPEFRSPAPSIRSSASPLKGNARNGSPVRGDYASYSSIIWTSSPRKTDSSPSKRLWSPLGQSPLKICVRTMDMYVNMNFHPSPWITAVNSSRCNKRPRQCTEMSRTAKQTTEISTTISSERKRKTNPMKIFSIFLCSGWLENSPVCHICHITCTKVCNSYTQSCRV